jgi:uncharacterized protein YbaA (DUF1428 family)
MTYIEGFVTAVPVANKDRYIAHAREAAAMVRAFGVTRFVETWADDVPRGTLNDLWGAVQAKDGEAVLFSWFEYPDRATRDAVNTKMMADSRMEDMARDMPFDGSRMIYGGFDSVSDVGGGSGVGYIDGIVLPLRDDARDAFGAFASSVAGVFLEYGALRVMDAVADDVRPGQHTDFLRAVHAADGERPALGWIEWPDKGTRDAGWEKIMAEPRMDGKDAPFDGKRMIFGGFMPILDL